MKTTTSLPFNIFLLKAIKALLLLAATVIVCASCSKREIQDVINQSNVTVGFQVAGIPVYVTIGNANTFVGYSYPSSAYGNYIPGSERTITTICYVLAKPTNPESVTVYDPSNGMIATVRCDGGTGATTNAVFLSLVAWFNNHPGQRAMVATEWTVPFTRGGDWHGTIKQVI